MRIFQYFVSCSTTLSMSTIMNSMHVVVEVSGEL